MQKLKFKLWSSEEKVTSYLHKELSYDSAAANLSCNMSHKNHSGKNKRLKAPYLYLELEV